MKVINTWIFSTTNKYMGRMVASAFAIHECENGKWFKAENGLFEEITEDAALVIVKPVKPLSPETGTGSAPVTEQIKIENNATDNGQDNNDAGILE